MASLPAHGDDLAELQRQVDELRQRIEVLGVDTERHWLAQRREAEVRGLVHDVLADADSRANLLADGLAAGHDGAFFIASPDGAFRLNFASLSQFRHVYNHQRSPPPGGDQHRSGFEVRRMQLIFSGHVIDPSWMYRVHGDFGRDGTFSSLDLFIEKRLDNDMRIRAGQFRPRLLLEQVTSSGRLLAAERSLINSRFGQGWTQGVQLAGPIGESARFTFTYHDGIPSTTGTMGSGRATPFNARTTEYAMIGSVELLLAGDWNQFRDFTSWAGDPVGLMLGAALAWQRDEHGTTEDVTQMLRWTVDASAKFGGANAMLVFVGNHEDTRGGGNVDQYGLLVQGGVHIVPDTWELFAQYQWGSASGMAKDLSVLTAGVIRYVARNRLKITADVGYGFNEVAPFWAATSAGWRADAPGEDGQVVVRSQVQFLF